MRWLLSTCLWVCMPLWACPTSQPLSYTLIAQHPHNARDFTQGLVFAGDTLVESTGRYGHSALISHAPGLGDRYALPERLFGEGVTWFRERLWQLTWRAGQLRIYAHQPLRLERTLRYRGQGWGLTDDGQNLYLSDGSAQLSVRRPEDFAELRRITVRSDRGPVAQLNELEWVDGRILANVWGTDHIAQIDPDSGCVVGWLDLSELWPHGLRPASADVLNGIAWQASSGHLWVTGKLWPRLYELKLEALPAASPGKP